MSPQIRKLLALTLGIIAGNVLAEMFILKKPGEEGGFIEIRDGIGLDEVARAASGVVAAGGIDWALRLFMGRRAG
ncbi:MAG: hypothetical protein L0191_10195 [Acidobacteria bacterium]|nr:hypothetical protein [Acidobacteriota bacterium]